MSKSAFLLELERYPKLAYVGDVPVEASYHGSALLYRLFEDYPAHKLLVVEGELFTSQSTRHLRLAHAHYATLKFGKPRLLRSRWAGLYGSLLALTSTWRSSGAARIVRAFNAQAIVTVSHGCSWVTADQIASRLKLPLFLICHDDGPHVSIAKGAAKVWLIKRFGEVYRHAAARFCVSPYMADKYKEAYGVDGCVLYPSRSSTCPSYSAPPERLTEDREPLTVAFGGSIFSPGYARALRQLARALLSIGGNLLIFGELSQEEAAKKNLIEKNITLCGSIESSLLITRYRENADVLFVPMSFDAGDRQSMESGFPSKLADYTAVGLPILVYGPPYSSVIRWARTNQNVAEIVDREDQEQLTAALLKLRSSRQHRINLARAAIEVGQKYFSYHTVTQTFHSLVSTHVHDQ